MAAPEVSAKEANQAASEAEGRRRHLGAILLVFRHRGGTWGDFGRFLQALFFAECDPTPGRQVYVGFKIPVRCRHNEGGVHHELLDLGPADPASRPCLSKDGIDDGKASGAVVHAIKKAALTYLGAVGKRKLRVSKSGGQLGQALSNAEEEGDGKEDTGGPSGVGAKRPSDTDPTDQPPLKRHELPVRGKQTNIDAYFGDIRGGAGTPPEDLLMEDDFGLDNEEIEELYERWWDDVQQNVQEEDLDSQGWVRQRMSSLAADTPVGSSSVGELTDYHDSQHSDTGGSRGSSIKIRWHVLGYLAGFADDPAKLKVRTLHLMDLENRLCYLLHLCGCGISHSGKGVEQSAGCCEPTHLRLGSPKENRAHTNFHETMRLCDPSDYPELVGIVRRGKHGAGLF